MRASNYKSSLSFFLCPLRRYNYTLLFGRTPPSRHAKFLKHLSFTHLLARSCFIAILSICVRRNSCDVHQSILSYCRALTKCFRCHYDSALIKSCFTIWLIFLANVEFHIFARYYVYIGREARRNSFVRACRWIDSSIDSEFMNPSNDRDLCAPTIRFSSATMIFIYHQRSDG